MHGILGILVNPAPTTGTRSVKHWLRCRLRQLYEQETQLSHIGRAMVSVIAQPISLSHSRSFEMTPLKKARVSVLLVFYCNYSSILYHFRDKAIYWSKIVFFSQPCILRSRQRVPIGILPYRFVQKKKLEWCGYPMVKMSDDNVQPFRHNTGV